MKKSKLLISALIVTSLGGALLTACGDRTSTIPSNEATSSVNLGVCSRIVVSTPTTDILVGDTLNLDSYVKVIGEGLAVNAYTAVSMNTDIATVEGHFVTVKAEGEISIEITAESANNKTAKFVATAMTEYMSNFKEIVNSFSKKYFCLDVKITNEGYIESLGTGTLHNERYFAYEDPYVYDDDGNRVEDVNGNYVLAENPIYTGIMQAYDGNSYEFQMDDLDGTNLIVNPGALVPFEYYYLSMGHGLSADNFYTTYLQGEPAGVASDDAAQVSNFCKQALGSRSPAELGAMYGETFTEELNIELVASEDGEVMLLAYVLFNVPQYSQVLDLPADTYLWSMNLIMPNSEICDVTSIDTYISEQKIPEALNATELKDAMSAIATAKNYTLTTEYFVSEDSTALAEPVDVADVALPVDTVTTYVDENTVYNVYEDETVDLYSVQDGQLKFASNYTVDKTTGAVTKNDTFTSEDVEGVTSIWDDATFSRLTVASTTAESLYSGLSITKNKVGSDSIRRITIDNNSAVADFAKAFVSLAGGYGFTLDEKFTKTGMYGYAYGNARISEDSVVVDVYFVYSQTATGYLFYHIRETFTNIGSTQVPSLEEIF